MKTFILLISLLVTGLSFAQTNEELCKLIVVGKQVERTSGKVIFVRSRLKIPIDINDLTEGKEFANEQMKQTFIKGSMISGKLDPTLKNEKTKYWVEKLYFKNDKIRRDYCIIDEETAKQIKQGSKDIKGLNFSIMTEEPDKTVSFVPAPLHDGKFELIAEIFNGKIYFPRFDEFGGFYTNFEYSLDNFTKLIDMGAATATQTEVKGKLHCIFEAPVTGMKTERVLDPNSGMATTYYASYMNNIMEYEIFCEDFIQTPNGHWFPQKSIEKRYVDIGGESVLSQSEEFIALPDTVEFNLTLDENTFSGFLPDGAEVTDYRYKPSLRYIVGEPKPEPPVN